MRELISQNDKILSNLFPYIQIVLEVAENKEKIQSGKSDEKCYRDKSSVKKEQDYTEI